MIPFHRWGNWGVSFAYLRLLLFLPAILTCALSNPAFFMMYSAYKLNKQGDNIQLWRTPFPIWNQSVRIQLKNGQDDSLNRGLKEKTMPFLKASNGNSCSSSPKTWVKFLIGCLDRFLVGVTWELGWETEIPSHPSPPYSEAKGPESPFFKYILLDLAS